MMRREPILGCTEFRLRRQWREDVRQVEESLNENDKKNNKNDNKEYNKENDTWDQEEVVCDFKST